jgi:hypothetical protein
MFPKLTRLEWLLLFLMILSLITWFVFLDRYFETVVWGVIRGY